MKSRPRWTVAILLFTFMLFHQADKMVISPLVTPIMEEFHINEAQMGAISSLALIVASLLYPFWGYFYDRYARPKAIALTSLIWGITTSLSALAPNFRVFMLTRASTGIDDSSHPGIYSLLSDYFGPKMRGKIYGLMHMAGPIGFMLGTILATTLGKVIGWRNIFIITGFTGIVIAVLIYLGIQETPRGGSEPELREFDEISQYRINWQAVRRLFKIKSLFLITIQGFFAVFPWNVLTFWFFRYLEIERTYTSRQSLLAMLVVIVALSVGFFVGGDLGDMLFKRFMLGRAVVAGAGIITGAISLYVTFTIPPQRSDLFLVLMGITGFVMAIPSPNVTAILHDIIPPEARSTAGAIRKLFEDGGAAVAPFLAGIIATRSSLHEAILTISLVAWGMSVAFFAPLIHLLPQDIENLREIMRKRACLEAEQD